MEDISPVVRVAARKYCPPGSPIPEEERGRRSMAVRLSFDPHVPRCATPQAPEGVFVDGSGSVRGVQCWTQGSETSILARVQDGTRLGMVILLKLKLLASPSYELRNLHSFLSVHN